MPKQQQKMEFSTRREAIRASRCPGERPDQTPVEIPLGKQQPPSLKEQMMQFVRAEIAKERNDNNLETFEDFDNFDVEDEDPDLTSPYTVVELNPIPGGYDVETPPEEPQRASEDEESALLKTPEGQGGEAAENTEPREVDKT